jgi:hypothetical protein
MEEAKASGERHAALYIVYMRPCAPCAARRRPPARSNLLSSARSRAQSGAVPSHIHTHLLRLGPPPAHLHTHTASRHRRAQLSAQRLLSYTRHTTTRPHGARTNTTANLILNAYISSIKRQRQRPPSTDHRQPPGERQRRALRACRTASAPSAALLTHSPLSPSSLSAHFTLSAREGNYTRRRRVFCIIRICIVFCIVFVSFGAGHGHP